MPMTLKEAMEKNPFEHLVYLAGYADIYKKEYYFDLTDQSKFESIHERVSEEASKRIQDDYVWHNAIVSFDFPRITIKPIISLTDEYAACLDAVSKVKKHNDFAFLIFTNKELYAALEKKITEESEEKDNKRLWNGVLVSFMYPEIHLFPVDFDFSTLHL